MVTSYFETEHGKKYGFLTNGENPKVNATMAAIGRHDRVVFRAFCPFIFDEDDAREYFATYDFPFEKVNRIGC